MTQYVLDTSALLAYIENEEGAADKIALQAKEEKELKCCQGRAVAARFHFYGRKRLLRLVEG